MFDHQVAVHTIDMQAAAYHLERCGHFFAETQPTYSAAETVPLPIEAVFGCGIKRAAENPSLHPDDPHFRSIAAWQNNRTRVAE